MDDPSIAKAYHLLADRDDQEREHAEWLARHAAELENQECDAFLARCAARRQQTDQFTSAGLITKEFPVERQLAGPQPPPQPLATKEEVLLVAEICGDETFKIIAALRRQLRKEFATEIGALRAEVAVLQSVAKQNGRTKRRA
jgi:hypothetical protein